LLRRLTEDANFRRNFDALSPGEQEKIVRLREIGSASTTNLKLENAPWSLP